MFPSSLFLAAVALVITLSLGVRTRLDIDAILEKAQGGADSERGDKSSSEALSRIRKARGTRNLLAPSFIQKAFSAPIVDWRTNLTRVRELGNGAYGKVYEVTQNSTCREGSNQECMHFALKIIPADKIDECAEEVTLQKQAQQDNKHAVKIEADWADKRGNENLLMELVPDGELLNKLTINGLMDYYVVGRWSRGDDCFDITIEHGSPTMPLGSLKLIWTQGDKKFSGRLSATSPPDVAMHGIVHSPGGSMGGSGNMWWEFLIKDETGQPAGKIQLRPYSGVIESKLKWKCTPQGKKGGWGSRNAKYLTKEPAAQYNTGVYAQYTPRVVFKQLVDGLMIMHKHKVTHRDMKPQNVFCDSSTVPPTVKIGDFGLAMTFEPGQKKETAAAGTPLFASPEIWKSSTTPYEGPEVDVWSLGVMLYYFVLAKLPFDDNGESADSGDHSVLAHAINTDPYDTIPADNSASFQGPHQQNLEQESGRTASPGSDRKACLGARQLIMA